MWDVRLTGFGVRVRPTGARSFIVAFRSPRTRKPTRVTLGNAERLAVDIARDAARKRLAQVELGEDPKLPAPRKSITVKDAVEQYGAEAVPRLAPAWGSKVKALLARRLVKPFGAAPLASVTRAELRALFAPLVLDHPASANELKRVLSAFMSWCVDRELIPANPLAGTKLPARRVSRERVLTESEIVAVLRASKEMEQPWGAFLQLLLLTGQRLSEVLGMHSDEIDADARAWMLPSERTKNRTSHIVPLSDAAWALIEPRIQSGRHVLGQTRKGGPVRFRQSVTDELRERSGVRNFRLHDLRRTAASMMAKLGVHPHVIEAVLNHRSGVISGVAAIYNRYTYAAEKREALALWAAHLAEIEAKDRREREAEKAAVVL